MYRMYRLIHNVAWSLTSMSKLAGYVHTAHAHVHHCATHGADNVSLVGAMPTVWLVS